MSNDPATDRADLTDLQRGESQALDRLIERWRRPLLGFAYRYTQNSTDANDLVAETFVRLHQQRERLRADTRLSAWLFTTLTNLCHNHHRWKRRHPTVPLEPPAQADGSSFPDSSGLASDEPTPAAALVHEEALDAVKTAIEELPHDLKVTVLLHHYEHLSYRDIGAVVGCSERGVESRLYRARQQLRIQLAGFIRESQRS